MQLITYDGSFAGFLSAIFDIYEYRLRDVKFAAPASISLRSAAVQASVPAQGAAATQPSVASYSSGSLFAPAHSVTSSEQRARRIWAGINKYISPAAAKQIYAAFLSEKDGMEDTLYRYIKYIFDSRQSVEKDYSHEAVLRVSQTAGKVHREKHRMEAFVRFKLTGDQLYYALVEPDFNVLPLISDHFERRYADQRWMIYDVRRKYGIYYDLHQVNTVTVQFDERVGAAAPDFDPLNEKIASADTAFDLHDEKEGLYQELWRRYFSSVNIPSRKNRKLHIQHMPYRYWKHLTEKQPTGYRG